MAEAIYATRYDRGGGTYNPYISADLGLSDGAQLTVSLWFKPNSPFNGSRLMRFPNGGLLYITNTNQLRLQLEDTGGGICRQLITTSGFTNGAWNHFCFSVDQSGSGLAQARLNGNIETGWTNYVGNNLDLSSGNFALAGTANSFDGCATEWWIDDVYIDFSDADELAKFYAAGKAADLGANGEDPTGGSPVCYLRGQYPNHTVNYGTGSDFTATTSSQMSECSDAPERDSGTPPTTLTPGYTSGEATLIQEAYVGTLAAAATQIGQISTPMAIGYIRPLTPTGETETLIYEDTFNICNFGTLDASVPVNSTYCGGSFGVGKLSGTLTSKQLAAGDRYMECRQTYDQANTLGENHTMMDPRVGAWRDGNRRLVKRTHYRFKNRVRLGADFQIATDGDWDIICQFHWTPDLTAVLNPPVSFGAFRGDGKYTINVRGSPIRGGPPDGNYATAPAGYEATFTGGNYFNDVGVWREWIIDYFNPIDPTGPNPNTVKDGFFRLTIGGEVVCEVLDQWIGHWHLDDDQGAEAFFLGVYKYPSRYGDRDVCTLDIDSLKIYEVTEGGAPAVVPYSVHQAGLSTVMASGGVRQQAKGNAVISTNFIY